MTTPLTPQEIKELAAGYVLGDLSSEEAEQFQKLLAQLPALAAEVAALQEALALMPYGLPEEQPEAQLRSQILSMAQTELSQRSQVMPAPTRQLRFKQQRLPWMVSAVAAGLAIAFGLSTLRLAGQVRTLDAQLQSPFPGDQRSGAGPADKATGSTGLGESDLDWLLQDHQKSLSNPNGPVDFVAHQPDAIAQQLQGFQTTVAALPLLPEDQGKLLGGSNCQIGKTNGLRLTYQLGTNQTVSAYQFDLGDTDQFLQLQQLPQFQLTYVTLYQPDGTGIVLWRDQDYLYAVVADLPPADLQALAHAIDRI